MAARRLATSRSKTYKQRLAFHQSPCVLDYAPTPSMQFPRRTEQTRTCRPVSPPPSLSLCVSLSLSFLVALCVFTTVPSLFLSLVHPAPVSPSSLFPLCPSPSGTLCLCRAYTGAWSSASLVAQPRRQCPDAPRFPMYTSNPYPTGRQIGRQRERERERESRAYRGLELRIPCRPTQTAMPRRAQVPDVHFKVVRPAMAPMCRPSLPPPTCFMFRLKNRKPIYPTHMSLPATWWLSFTPPAHHKKAQVAPCTQRWPHGPQGDPHGPCHPQFSPRNGPACYKPPNCCTLVAT
jgi:hypothetical protein